MLLVVEKGVNEPVNLGSGTGITIRQIAEMVAKHVPDGPIDIAWDTSKPAGDARRIMDMKRAASHGFACEIGIEEGIKDTIDWFVKNRNDLDNRYIAFSDPAMKEAG
jgi:GDP-L-fucose synthase